MKTDILRALSCADGYVSGQELCESLKVSRTAVWKVIGQLREDGYEIESVPGKGYRILKRPDCLTAEEIASRLNTKWAAQTLRSFDVIDSTNNEVKRMAEQGAPDGTLVLAEEQEQGKGRRGRSWVTPAGSAIAMSLLLRPRIAPDRASMLTIVMGLAVADACRELFALDVGIKWPNDVVIQGRKICGILTEMSSEIDYINYVVIGTGINTNIGEFPEELRERAVSLHTLIGRRPDRALLVDVCMEKFEQYYEQFLETQDLSLLTTRYNDLLVGKGSLVRVLAPGDEHEGVSEGIDTMGNLLVQLADGSVERVFAGEVSVRGVYGYV